MIRFLLRWCVFALAMPLLQGQLVFDQNPQMIRCCNDGWVVKAYTSELACRKWKDVPVPCWVAITVRTNSDRLITVSAENEIGHRKVPALLDYELTATDFPWTSGPISFSGTWKRDPHGTIHPNIVENFPFCYGLGTFHPACRIPSFSAVDLVGEAYSGSFDFDLDGGGQPINVSVSFTLSEP